MEVHQWMLDTVALLKRQAYAAHVQLRRPSMTLRIERNRQDLEIGEGCLVCIAAIGQQELLLPVGCPSSAPARLTARIE